MVSFIPRPLQPQETPSLLTIGGWVGPRAVPDVVEERKISCPYRKSHPDPSVVQPLAEL
jgi:hypothetical protein